MIILLIVFVLAVMFASCLFGCAVGYSEGYEAHMLETMSDKEKNEYLTNKELSGFLLNEQRKYDL